MSEISPETKIEVWQNQIENAMPNFDRLHKVAKVTFEALVENKMIEAVQEVRTYQDWVGFKICFKKLVYGRSMAKFLKAVEPSWIETTDHWMSMMFNDDNKLGKKEGSD